MLDALYVTAFLVGWAAWFYVGVWRLLKLWKSRNPEVISWNKVECDHAQREAAGTQTWIDNCPACGQRHRVALVLYAEAPTGYTHWYFCPINRDPVSLEMALRLPQKESRPALAS